VQPLQKAKTYPAADERGLTPMKNKSLICVNRRLLAAPDLVFGIFDSGGAR
jgi:hypothetical protein